MSRALINKEAVFKAAKNLTEHGVFPTQSRVREHLGHGSMRDIGFYLREWKQQCMAANKSSPILQEELAYATLETENLENSNKKLIKQKMQRAIIHNDKWSGWAVGRENGGIQNNMLQAKMFLFFKHDSAY